MGEEEKESIGSTSEPKTVLARALQALPAKKDQIEIIKWYAMLEFKAGRLEQGRTMLNSIIQTNPKRGDIVSILIDMEIKYGKK